VTKSSVSSLTHPLDAIPTAAVGPKLRPAHRHPNLGLAPVSMTAGFTEAADKLRRDSLNIAGRALIAATEADATIKERYSEVELRRLRRDSEVLTERLAMCLASDDPRWLGEFAAWSAPIYRRRGVTLLDLAALCAGIHRVIEPDLNADELGSAGRALDAAITVFRRDSRLAGDRRKRNALWKWMYRGV
jgi:hypothetical protein